MRVTYQHTAIGMGSGDMPVFATPAMVALMEKAALAVAATHCTQGQTSVGTMIAVQHKRASPLGATVSATAILISQEDRKLTFKVVASDEKGEIGSGEHQRFIVDQDRFMEKL